MATEIQFYSLTIVPSFSQGVNNSRNHVLNRNESEFQTDQT